jgi:Domain of Unknown Function (DUF908)
LKSLLSNQVTIPPNWAGYYFHYYKRAPSATLPSGSIPPRPGTSSFSPVTPTPKSRDGPEAAAKSLDSSITSDGKPTEGWVRLHISPEVTAKQGIEPTFRDLVNQTNIPKDDQFRLFVQVMVAHYYSDATRREQFLRCQLYAISSLGTLS